MRDKATQIQRAYEGIKSEILAGAFRPGERLESRLFEGKYNTSSTTIRMALSRLTGERLIEAAASDGFHVPIVTELWLYDIYIANRILLRGCLELVLREPEATEAEDEGVDVVTMTENLINDIAAATGNAELIAQAASLNERLRVVRLLKAGAIPDRAIEIERLQNAWARRDIPDLLAGLEAYHQARIDRLRDIVQQTSRRPR